MEFNQNFKKLNAPRAVTRAPATALFTADFDVFYGCFPNTRERYEWSSLDKFYAMLKAADFHSRNKRIQSIHCASSFSLIPYHCTHRSIIFVLRLFVNGLRALLLRPWAEHCTINLCNMLTMLFQLFFSLFASIDSFSHCASFFSLLRCSFRMKNETITRRPCFDREQAARHQAKCFAEVLAHCVKW